MSTAINPTLRDILNSGDPAEIALAMKQFRFGDMLAALVISGAVNIPGAVTATNAGGTYTSAEQTLINSLKTQLNLLITAVTSAAGVTEQALVPSSSVLTLANTPSAVLNVNLTAAGSGGSTGVKKVTRGEITGPNALTPAPGECVWNGNKSILLNAADVGTGGSPTANVDYVRTADATPSVLQQNLGIA